MDNPLEAAKVIGDNFARSQMMGVNSPGDGMVLALTCMSEGITPLAFIRKYHLVEGRPSMRADAMGAEFRKAGGKIKWLNIGDDGKEARAEFTFEGETTEIAYTAADGKKAAGDKFEKKGSNWQRDLGAMLRARLITKAVRMLAPEIVAGVYDPDEITDAVGGSSAPTRTAEEVAARKVELEQMDDGPVVDAEFEVKDDPPADTVPAAAGAEPSPFQPQATEPEPEPEPKSGGPCSNEQLHKLVELGSQMGKSVSEIQQGICDACKVEKPADMTEEQAATLIQRFEGMLAS